MLSRHSVGSGRAQVIPADWESAHAVVAASTLTGVCTVYASTVGAATIGDDLDYSPAPPVVIAEDVACRVQSWTDTTPENLAGSATEVRARYLVVLDRAIAGVVPGCGVVPAGTGDPDLDGAWLWVEQEKLGTLRWERDLVCVTDRTVGDLA